MPRHPPRLGPPGGVVRIYEKWKQQRKEEEKETHSHPLIFYICIDFLCFGFCLRGPSKNMKVELKCLMGKVLDSTAILILNFGGKSGLGVEIKASEVQGHL